MKSAEYLRELLRPLGVYELRTGAGAGELESAGAALDGGAALLEEIQREMLLLTAEGEGLDKIESLLSRKPVTSDTKRRRAALAALSIAHYAYVLEVGRVVMEAPGKELLQDPKVKEAYLGG